MLRMGWALVLPALLAPALSAAEALPPAVGWVPQDAVLVLDLVLGPRVANFICSAPAFKEQASRPEFRELLKGVSYIEGRLGADWKTLLRKLLGGGITLAFLPDGGALLFIDAEEEAVLRELNEILIAFAKIDAARRGQPARVISRQVEGALQWTIGGEEAHAIVGRCLVVANRPAVLKAALELRGQPNRPSLASLPAYQTAKAAAADKAAATAFVNLALLKKSPAVQQTLKEASSPLGSLLLAGMFETLRESNWLLLALRVEGETLALEATVDGKVNGSGPAAFATPDKVGQGAQPNLVVPRQVAGASFYRELPGFYAAKDKLFPERTSGLIFFENMMGIFFSGRDLTEEVLAETGPEIRIVVAGQEYDRTVGVPQMQVPAFAAIFRLRHPEEFTRVVEEAWQKGVGLINVVRGQKAQPGLIIDRDLHAGTKFSVAYFSQGKEEDREYHALRLNYRPSLARVGDYPVLSSTDGLARDLIDALQKVARGPAKALAGIHSRLEIDGGQLASILQANRTNLVSQNMLQKGNSQEQAEAQVDGYTGVLRVLGRMTLEVGSQDGRPWVRLEIKLNLP